MKKLIVVALLLSFVLPGFAQVENIAKDVLKAYKNRNVEELKKHASGFFKYAISDSYFNDDEIKSDLKFVDSWDGKMKEIRYSTGDVMGNIVTLASVYYADNPDNKDEICIVILSTTDKTNWVMFAGGLSTETRTEFQKMSLTLEANKETAAKKSSKKCNIEMADGDKFENVDAETISKFIDKLNEDNFYVILSSGDDYIQAAYSDMGFIIQYAEGGEQFEAEDYLTKEQANDIMKKYLLDEDWKQGNNWIEPSY